MLVLVAIRYVRSDSVSADLESSKNKDPDLLEMLLRTRPRLNHYDLILIIEGIQKHTGLEHMDD